MHLIQLSSNGALASSKFARSLTNLGTCTHLTIPNLSIPYAPAVCHRDTLSVARSQRPSLQPSDISAYTVDKFKTCWVLATPRPRVAYNSSSSSIMMETAGPWFSRIAINRPLCWIACNHRFVASSDQWDTNMTLMVPLRTASRLQTSINAFSATKTAELVWSKCAY